MIDNDTIKIANAQAFWGDRSNAASELVEQVVDLDFLTLDYLAEVSMSILAIQKEKDSSKGYAQDFLEVISSLVDQWKKNPRLKLVTNAGGLNPIGCAEACKILLQNSGISNIKIGVVSGDDVLHELKTSNANSYPNLDTNQSIGEVQEKLETANTYIGSKPIVDALRAGAQIVITGRVADPCLTAAPCIAHFGWDWSDYNRIASAIIAGHLIECGTQVTGGFSTHWMDYPDMDFPGYPVIEMHRNGTFVVTKPENTGGIVNIETVKEQLLYEIGDPDNYLCPDTTVSFLSLKLDELAKNRIQVSGAIGNPPPKNYKVSATYKDGYRIEGMITIFGRNCRDKALRCGEIVLKRLKKCGYNPIEYHVECLGTGDVVPSVYQSDTLETVLRISAKDQSKDSLIQLSKEIAPLVTSGPQGTTGYMSGRPKIRPVYSFWPTLIENRKVNPQVHIIEVK
ncbi:MAG: acyclic terpene utilization AtuA family protein [Chlamydiota bacterium]|nr:acyclic terpene utilization AtuA family protein [Chlamydiota bacterium]